MKKNKSDVRTGKILNLVLFAICCVLLFITSLAYFAARWYITVFGDTGFDSILSTLTAGVGGAESNLVTGFLLRALVPALFLSCGIVLFLFVRSKRNLVARIGEKIKIILYPFPRILSIILSLILSVVLLYSGAVHSGLVEYVQMIRQTSGIFDDEYVDPAKKKIKFPEEKQNLIYIFLESMETSFLSVELGGGNDVTPIPELYQLARDNVNFSSTDSVGGVSALSGGTWTIGAMVSQTSGVPLKVPFGVDGNDYGQEEFLPGITTLSDILHEEGYYQALMVGSDATFGGRKQYYEQHGTDQIYDLYTARQDGIVPENYYVWWGMEDQKLFSYAKQELIKMADSDQPFAFTMLTADTHHIGGYVCDLCRSEYEEQYENVLACSSRQVSEFVAWIQQQDFYENTTIVICGDHPTMDSEYITSNIQGGTNRTIYNCFINAKAEPVNSKNRVCSTLDMLPTTLVAMGCSIPGERLGLGTNLFSKKKTLAESMGLSVFYIELQKTSRYYEDKFYSK